MSMLTVFLSSLLTVCPGTNDLYCGDATPAAYTDGVRHGPGHNDSQNRDVVAQRGPEPAPERSEPDPEPAC